METRWRQETVFFSGDAFFEALLTELSAARSSIEVETYIFSKDEFGEKIESELMKAAARGATVRLVVDGIGARGWIGRWSRGFERAGIGIRVYHPFSWWRFLLSPLMIFRGSRRFLLSLNRRNHRKVWIIDGKSAWVGSMNITAHHLSRYHGPDAWRDTGVRVEGEAVSALSQAFEHIWARSQGEDGRIRWINRLKPTRAHSTPLVRLNFTRRLRSRGARDLRQRIRGAREKVWITNPYFAPGTRFIRALNRARERGVDVRLLVPRQSDVFFMRWVATSYYGPLLKAGVRIFEYLPRVLHAKSVLVDDWVSVGTSNLNQRSFRHDLEVDIVLTAAESRRELEEQFVLDLQKSEEITLEMWKNKIWMGRLGRLVVFFLRRWI